MSYKDKPQIKLYKYENASFVLQAIIDDFQEVSFEHNLYEAGQFTISINYNIPNALKFERGLFVQFGSNPYDFGEILTVQDSIGEDGKGSQIRTITGYDARYLLKRRVIKNMNSNGLWSMTGKGEIVLRNLIKDQCGSGAEAKRQLPITNVIPASESALGNEFSVSENFTNLYEVCKTIATQSEIGWRIKFDGTLTLEVYQGQDLSQTVRFDTNFESLANGEFSDSAESYTNAIYIGGKGQNDDRDIYEGEDGEPSGLDRFESWDNQSSMTTEDEYEAEALSMLTQYGQTLTMNGNGLAKCPYVFREQYDIGDTVTVAFSGKSATAQILSITEHWTWGAYDISFAFGKPQNNLSDQLQLMLRKIQEASNKTNSTDSVRWYTIPTDTAMPKADVTYNTIGFVGTVGTGATFKLYLDNQKTGSKTYHVYFKQLAGSGKLTLTTGKAGATNLVLSVGTYVAIIYVDENGNVTNTASTPTATIEAGSTQPVTSGGVANALDVPTDAVLHYSFDEVPDYPDGSADVKLLNNNTYDLQSTSYKFNQPSDAHITITNANGNVQFNFIQSGVSNAYINVNTIPNKIIIVEFEVTDISGTLRLSKESNGRYNEVFTKIGKYRIIWNYGTDNRCVFSNIGNSTGTIKLLAIYIGNGSYSTPIIDNANGQNNATNNGGIAVQGVSGKGAYFPSANQFANIPTSKYPAPTSDEDKTLSLWLKLGDYVDDTSSGKPILSIGTFTGLYGLIRMSKKIYVVIRTNTYNRVVSSVTLENNVWYHAVMVYSKQTRTAKLYVNGVFAAETGSVDSGYTFGSGQTAWWVWSNSYVLGNASSSTNQPATIDDVLFFNRALSETEVQALYLNKANTPKYYSWADWRLSQL